MRSLTDTYWQVRKIIREGIEPLESVQLVETYRRYWKPEKVKIILLAESHVFTSDDDRRIPIPRITELPSYPELYARFVYCLGYGERSLTNSHLHPKGDGTPQFWKIFFSCNNTISCSDDFGPILGKTQPQQRLRNKIALLKDLKARGIWLVDASVVALYKAGEKVPQMRSALQTSWESYRPRVI